MRFERVCPIPDGLPDYLTPDREWWADMDEVEAYDVDDEISGD